MNKANVEAYYKLQRSSEYLMISRQELEPVPSRNSMDAFHIIWLAQAAVFLDVPLFDPRARFLSDRLTQEAFSKCSAKNE